ncbi:hypothetical protein [uncultured Erythrobacter sp.]|uniref:hypothetical protein n=1 Tax=uncultured Erythrobacter sp. TaxID=263913 RepID=UPI002608ECE8|nr:hypothetical protein [uncultured Erythrobacter sp.]
MSGVIKALRARDVAAVNGGAITILHVPAGLAAAAAKAAEEAKTKASSISSTSE